MGSDTVFREVQQFRQRWLWALLTGVALLTILFGPISWAGLVVVGGVAAFLYSIRLRTEVRDDGIYVRMWPLHRTVRRISWSSIADYEARTYSPLREFGGWGIRWAPGKIAYNVSGNRGVWIERKNGKDVLVGSQQPEQFVRAIDEAYEP